MAREFAKVMIKIWADGDFRALTDGAQSLYFKLLSSPTMNLAGVADWRPKRLAALTAGMTAGDVEQNAEELQAAGFVVVDEDTEEILLRTFVRHDGVIKTPNIAAAMVKDYAGVASQRLREVIVHELLRLHGEEPALSGWRVVGPLLSHPHRNPSPNPSGNPSINPSGNPSPNPSGMPYPNPSGTASDIPQPADRRQQPADCIPAKPPGRTPLPDGWQPTDEHRARAERDGLDLDREADAFRAHAEANARTAVKWNAAFTQWLIKSGGSRRPGFTPRPSERDQRIDGMKHLLAEQVRQEQLMMEGEKRDPF